MTAALPLSTNILAPSVLEERLLRNFTIPGHSINRITKEDMSAEDVNLIVTTDMNGVNAGVMLFRRTKWTAMLLDLWMDPLLIEKNFEGREQDALVHLMNHHDHIFDHVGVVDQRAINAYGFDGDWGYHEGDLLVHFAGCWVQNMCESQWEKYWTMRSPVPVMYLQGDRQFP